MLDLQAGQTGQDVADYWTEDFLGATLGITKEQGTRMLASAVRKSWDAATEASEREQLFAAITAIRQSPRQRWSLEDFANEYLQDEVKQVLRRAAPNAESLVSNFDFDRETFDKTLQFRIFQLDSHVFVSSPFSEVGRSVNIATERRAAPGAPLDLATLERRLTVEGVIVDERITTRRA